MGKFINKNKIKNKNVLYKLYILNINLLWILLNFIDVFFWYGLGYK